MGEVVLGLIFTAGMCLFSGYFGYRAWFSPNKTLDWTHKKFPLAKKVDVPGCWINAQRILLFFIFIMSLTFFTNLVIGLFHGV